RGGTTWQVTPTTTQTRRLYVATTGDDANDGLNSNFPMATPSAARVIMEELMGRSNGVHRIVLAAGTYAGAVGQVRSGGTNNSPRYIDGPDVRGHPNVPTAIFAMTGNASGTCFTASRYSYVIASNIKVGGATAGNAFVS